MTDKRILVPVDFSEISQKVVNTAILLAVRMKMQITLLHVQNEKKHANPYALLKELSFLANEKLERPAFDFLVKEGNLFNAIKDESRNEKYGLMVVGSHGFKGVREKIFGTDILRLLKGISVPAMVIQDEYQITTHTFKKILFPTGSHQGFEQQIKATIDLASAIGSEIHLYTIEKPGVEFSAELKKNLKLAESEFMKHGVNFKKVTEAQTFYSVGFAKQIMAYAVKEEMDLVAIMANPTREHHYIADADKVSLLTNSSCIPVLSANAKINMS